MNQSNEVFNWYEPGAWDEATCSFCGDKTVYPIEVVVLLHLPNADSETPFCEMSYCKKCWEENGIESAFHSREELTKFINGED